ncbi:cytochrome c [Uliginosibacterium sediminicola]|uniref:Cytochrome c n=1 Tax=Uliginosibacterium sediminicola TaxID=2024550 RepID=A0ABU9YWD7_9RHOO
MKLRSLALLALAALSASSAFAQSKPEDQIRLRQGGFQLLARNVGALGAVAKGDVAFNKDAVQQRAEYINALVADLAAAGFAPGSDKGLPTRASAKIWSEPEAFKAAVEKLSVASKKLNSVNDVAGLRAAIGEVQGSCKNCHDSFRDSSYH